MGIFLTIAPTYCSEVGPPALRGALVAAVNFSIVIGQLLGYGVMRETQAIEGKNAYRIMYAVQWGFAGVGLALLPFLPDSPFRLLARSKDDAARKAIRKIYGRDTNVEKRVDEIREILTNEEAAAQQSGSFRDCFNSVNRTRTITALSVFVVQNMSGIGWVVGELIQSSIFLSRRSCLLTGAATRLHGLLHATLRHEGPVRLRCYRRRSRRYGCWQHRLLATPRARRTPPNYLLG